MGLVSFVLGLFGFSIVLLSLFSKKYYGFRLWLGVYGGIVFGISICAYDVWEKTGSYELVMPIICPVCGILIFIAVAAFISFACARGLELANA